MSRDVATGGWKDEMEVSEHPRKTANRNARKISLSGYALINSPRLNKGTAFSDAERDEFHLHGLLPPHVGTLAEQIERRLQALREQPTSFHKYTFLRDLQDANETLFYSLILQNIAEVLPLVYTPTVGRGARDSARFGESREDCFLAIPTKIASIGS